MTLTDKALDEFRDAWLAAEGDDFASRLQRQSLEALAAENVALHRTLFELTNRAQSELDLHLTGDTVHGHDANAEWFAQLVRGVADATKEVAKHLLDRQRRASTLRILALSPGSVRVVLRAATPEEAAGRTAQMTRTPSVDSKSLDTVAVLLARSQAEGANVTDDVLSGLAANLPQKAHAGLKRAARAIDAQDWDVEGELRSQHGFQRIHVGPAGAKALLRVLDERQESTTEVTLVGAIDGQRRSVGALWFAPDGAGAIEAAVPTAELMEQVVQHDAANQRVQAVFDVVTIIGKGANPRRRDVYTLRSIEPLPDAPTLL
ncbi:hypothetical protein [Microbacterium stercoris]|uniref:Uncharacterized protein n=1 Tax=Microbacterium stercoris TaxID=2820289 RepID=A0A939QSW5_9MICO|nr:hypothetical protein [Microbacterium stercoris]MBO3664568.1 hypothetical protein [Microbacterium stercoris]